LSEFLAVFCVFSMFFIIFYKFCWFLLIKWIITQYRVNTYIYITYRTTEDHSFFDNDIKAMHSSVTRLLDWGIKSKIAFIRPDLSLTYYPSIMNFYWFVARNV